MKRNYSISILKNILLKNFDTSTIDFKKIYYKKKLFYNYCILHTIIF